MLGKKRKKIPEQEAEVAPWRLWLRLAMPWEVPPGWAFLEPVSHALGLGKDHRDVVECRKGFLELRLA